MSRKILLRRPRCYVNEVINVEKTISDSETRATSFKDDIQTEIELLDKEYTKTSDKNDEIKNENELEVTNSDAIPFKVHEISVVSLCNMDEGLKPVKLQSLKRESAKSRVVKISEKTAKEFERQEQFSSNAKAVCNQNIFEQIEQQLPVSHQTVPKHIILIQLAALLKCQVANNTEKGVSCAIKSLPKFGHFPLNWKSTPKYEIILYENENIGDMRSISPHKISDILQRDLMNTNVTNNQRNIFEEGSDQEISPVNVSMMECLMTGKQYLSFAGHSISKIPNIADIFQNLTALDLSFNFFKKLPVEIYQLQHLDSLNVRNNPLQMLDDFISDLSSLRILICSFTLISNVPSSLFRCKNLEQADLSYNNIYYIPHIDGSSKLQVLNLSGNPIRYFKKSFTKLNLTNLGLENTWIHPIFWKNGEFVLSDLENSWAFCDICDQVFNDFSINYIAFTRKFDHILPILMSFCSTLCRDANP